VRRVFAEAMAANTASRRVPEKADQRHARTCYPRRGDPIEGSADGEVGYELLLAGWNG